MEQMNINIPKNDGKVDDAFNKAVEKIVKEINGELRNNTTAMVYANHYAGAEQKFRFVAKEYIKQGYHCALNYIPNGLQALLVSKVEIGYPSGRLVTREWL